MATFLESRPAGVVVFGSIHSSRTQQLLDAANTQVLEISELNANVGYLTMAVDHFKMGKQATEHLIQRGFKKIGFIGARTQHSTLQQKLHGWQSAMLENYLTPDHFLTTHEGPSAQLGVEGVSKLLLREAGLDALICSHEDIAIGALFECHRRVIKVPWDMAIISLEGASMGAHAFPSLTCLEVDYEKMGAKAAEMLLHAVKNEAPPSRVEVNFTLQVRASTSIN